MLGLQYHRALLDNRAELAAPCSGGAPLHTALAASPRGVGQDQVSLKVEGFVSGGSYNEQPLQLGTDHDVIV